jgi:hypothetical protein
LFVPGANTFEVFGTGTGGRLLENTWQPRGGWQGWRDLGAGVTGTPSAINDSATGNVEVYATGVNGVVKEAALTRGSWTALRNVGQAGVTGSPSATYDYRLGQPDVFAASGGQLTVRAWSPGGGWTQASLGGKITDSPAAIYDTLTGNVEVYYKGADSAVKENAHTRAGWTGVINLGGFVAVQLNPVPFVSPLIPAALDIFATIGGRPMELSWHGAWGWWKVVG